ncbi:MAG: hypothetical protein ACRDY2_06400 [Acidimicrobiales bacterium]
MNPITTLAAAVGARAELLSVALRTVTATIVPLAPGVQVEISTSWTTRHDRDDQGEVVEYAVDFAVGGLRPCAPSVRGQFVLQYRIPGLRGVSDEQLQAFGQVSVAFSAFPYLRELVQSLTVRAGLPALVLGTLRAPVDPPPEELGDLAKAD